MTSGTIAPEWAAGRYTGHCRQGISVMLRTARSSSTSNLLERSGLTPAFRGAEFREMYEDWSASRTPPRTARNERTACKRVTETIAPVRLKDVTRARAEQIITFIMRPDEKGHVTSPAGANFYIRALRSIYSVAVRWKLLEENPFSGMTQLSFDLPTPRILTRAEIARFFASLQKNAPDYVPLIAFYLVTAYAGMKRCSLNGST